jgi:hypothetical protein
MALSISEIEIQTTEYLPAREVMTGLGVVKPAAAMDAPASGGILNGVNVEHIASGIDVSDTQFGLVNLLVHHVDDAIDVGTVNS